MRFLFTSFSILFFILLQVCLQGCATSPLGRKQLILMPESQMVEMGAQSFQELKKTTAIETGQAVNDYVRCVAVPITEAARSQTSVNKWEIVVFRENTVNAFALPGGKIGVYTGILKVAESPAQLAAILGHEVGHVIANHGNERVSESVGVNLGASLVEIGAASLLSKESSTRGLVLAGLGIGVQYGIMLPFSRTHESEADLIGLKLMAGAGFDPTQSVELWKNMGKAGGSGPPQILSTHPSNETRIHNLEEHMSDAKVLYAEAKKSGRSPVCVKPAGY